MCWPDCQSGPPHARRLSESAVERYRKQPRFFGSPSGAFPVRTVGRNPPLRGWGHLTVLHILSHYARRANSHTQTFQRPAPAALRYFDTGQESPLKQAGSENQRRPQLPCAAMPAPMPFRFGRLCQSGGDLRSSQPRLGLWNIREEMSSASIDMASSWLSRCNAIFNISTHRRISLQTMASNICFAGTNSFPFVRRSCITRTAR